MMVAKRINIKSSHQKKKFCNYVWWQILSRFGVVITLRYIEISNHYVVHLKLTQSCMSSILQFKKKKKKTATTMGDPELPARVTL